MKTIQNNALVRVDVEYRVEALRDGRPVGPGDPVTDLRVARRTRTYPVTKGGRVQWSQEMPYTGEPMTVPVDEVAELVGALTSGLATLLQEAQSGRRGE